MSEYLQNLLVAAEHLTGFVLVMLTLCLLWGLTALMGRLAARFTPPTQASVTPAVSAAPTPRTESEPAIPDEDVVVIAATVAAMIDARHRVVAVRPLHSSWGQQGRRDIHASHRIR